LIIVVREIQLRLAAKAWLAQTVSEAAFSRQFGAT